MDPRRPQASAVLVRDGRIAWVGSKGEEPPAPADRAMDCGGATLLPGLNDAHIHLLAYAASLADLDCGRHSAASIADIQRLLRQEAAKKPLGEGIRGRGYDEFYLAERRHPSRADLDVAAPHHLVRLNHRSGHACVLNTLALERLGIGPDTPDPSGGSIGRDASGQPTGLLLEMNDYVSQRSGDRRSSAELRSLVAEASQRLLRWGVTSLQDASPENDVDRWHLFRDLKQEGMLRQRAAMMPGVARLPGFADAGLGWGAEGPDLRLGHAKLVVTLTTGRLHPSQPDLKALVLSAYAQGFPVAIHAVEEEAILQALEALRSCRAERPPALAADRIEHCSEAMPRVLNLLKRGGVAVVTQPAFLYESAERYMAQVPRRTLPWIYPLRALADGGILLAAGSDAPVAAPQPWQGLYGAMARRSASGTALHPEQGLSLAEALRLYTTGAAAVEGQRALKGAIRPGKLADLVLLDRRLDDSRPDELLRVRAVLTIIGGSVVWEG